MLAARFYFLSGSPFSAGCLEWLQRSAQTVGSQQLAVGERRYVPVMCQSLSWVLPTLFVPSVRSASLFHRRQNRGAGDLSCRLPLRGCAAQGEMLQRPERVFRTWRVELMTVLSSQEEQMRKCRSCVRYSSWCPRSPWPVSAAAVIDKPKLALENVSPSPPTLTPSWKVSAQP